MSQLSKAAEILDLDPESFSFTCVGHARTQGRRCRNRIAAANSSSAADLLAALKVTTASSRRLDTELHKLTPLVLCKRWHQDQASDMVEEWRETIEEYRETRRAEQEREARRNARRVEREREAENARRAAREQEARTARRVERQRDLENARRMQREREAENARRAELERERKSEAAISNVATAMQTLEEIMRELQSLRAANESVGTSASRPFLTSPTTSLQNTTRPNSTESDSATPSDTSIPPPPYSTVPPTPVEAEPSIEAASPVEIEPPVEAEPIVQTEPLTEPETHVEAEPENSTDDGRRPLEGECSICQEELDNGSVTKWCKAQCRQNFHGDCVDTWLGIGNRSKRCPYW